MPHATEYTIRWAELDPNGHVRHSAYADFAADQRVQWLASLGYDQRRFAELRLGPILFREETVFKRELHSGERIRVDGHLTKSTPDGGRWTIEHHIYKTGGELAATVTVDGAWLDLDRRKLTLPPTELREAMRAG